MNLAERFLDLAWQMVQEGHPHDLVDLGMAVALGQSLARDESAFTEAYLAQLASFIKAQRAILAAKS
jgi:hypothetical protein